MGRAETNDRLLRIPQKTHKNYRLACLPVLANFTSTSYYFLLAQVNLLKPTQEVIKQKHLSRNSQSWSSLSSSNLSRSSVSRSSPSRSSPSRSSLSKNNSSLQPASSLQPRRASCLPVAASSL
jgi:hypothetical protein